MAAILWCVAANADGFRLSNAITQGQSFPNLQGLTLTNAGQNAHVFVSAATNAGLDPGDGSYLFVQNDNGNAGVLATGNGVFQGNLTWDGAATGPSISVGSSTSTGGYSSTATNAATVTATGWTNSLGMTCVVNITAATGLALYDNLGTNEFTGVTIASLTQIRVQAGGRITGTGVTAAGKAHAW